MEVDGEEEESDDEYRERMLALFVLVALGSLALGMGIAFFLDWLQTTIL